MKKRILALVLLAVFTLSLILTACDPQEAESNVSSGEVSSEVSAQPSEYKADVPDVKFEGESFVILTPLGGASPSERPEFGGDGSSELVEDTINTAVSLRNGTVEEKLGIDITERYVFNDSRVGGAIFTTVTNAVDSGLCDFSLCAPSLYDSASLAKGGYYVDLYSLKYLHNLSEPWWDKSFNDGVTIAGKLLFAQGDMGIVAKDAIPAIMFNKEMAQANGLENFYELVQTKKWTFDKLYSLCKSVSEEVDGIDGISYNDIYGIGGQNDNMKNMFYGAGERIAIIGSEGKPILTMYNERSANVVEKIQVLMQDKDCFVCANDYFGVSSSPVDLLITSFIENRSLFFTDILGRATDLREMKVDFGILPIPLYDEEQESYYSLVGAWTGNAFGVPYSYDDETLEMISIVLETMGAVSKNILTPAYYDVVLMGQITRDDDSQKMLEIMFETKGTDLGLIFQWGGYSTVQSTLITSAVGTFRSLYEANEQKGIADIEDTVEAFNDID